jgi:integrase
MYYVAFWDEEVYDYVGRRSTGRLLSEIPRKMDASPSSQAGARLIVEAWLEHHSPGRVRSGLAADYLERFWDDEGAYAKSKEARGKPLSAQYLYSSRLRIKKFVRPFLERQSKPISLDRLTPALLEELAMELYDQCTSAKTANQVLVSIGKALEEGVRLGLLRDNPMRRVEKLAEEDYVRQILTREEVKAFFALSWSDPRHYAINLLAATTGMRLGECRGLLVDDLRPGGIHVCHNWQDKEKEKEKNKGPKGSKGAMIKARDIPLPPSTERVILELADHNPWKDGFVFFGDRKSSPLGKQIIETAYSEALAAIGIEDDRAAKKEKREPHPGSRQARGLGFHAWRHWFNSYLRGKVDDHVLQALTGHQSQEMTDHYTEVTAEQREAVAKLAEGLI